MGIMAGRTGCLLIDNVKTVTAIPFPGAAECAEALIVKNAVPTVAFVAKRIIRSAFDGLIRSNQPAFQQRGEGRTMRATWAGAARTWPLIVVMTIRALNGGD